MSTPMSTVAASSTDLDNGVAEARKHLDDHVRDVVSWHFDQATGCPFWLEKARTMGFDPLKDIQGYDDLKLFGCFDDEQLRGGPVRRFLPRGFRGRPFRVFETGGTTGIPKTRIDIQDFTLDYEIFSDGLDDRTFPRGSDWLMLGPTGPRRLRLAIEHLALYRSGTAFHVDCDPRWVGRLREDRRDDELKAYKNHVVEQALVLLRAHEIRCLFTTPSLLHRLCERISLDEVGITGIFCGGTEMDAEFHRLAREELAPGVDFRPVYGNTLMGLAASAPFDPERSDYRISYYPPLPRAICEIVDPKDPNSTVGYGETGRVMLTTLTREFFLPRYLERDAGEREPPIEGFPWDGVSGLRPFEPAK